MTTTIRLIAATVFLVAGAAWVNGEIHSDKDEMSRKGNTWKDNSTTASPTASTWTTVSPSVSTGAAVSPNPR